MAKVHKNRVVSKRKIREFLATHPAQARHREALMNWYREATLAPRTNFAAVRETYGGADQVGRYVVFNVAGNHLRVVTEIRYNAKPRLIYLRHVATHAEYDKLDLAD
jgi:mRNA interferase HigB